MINTTSSILTHVLKEGLIGVAVLFLKELLTFTTRLGAKSMLRNQQNILI